MRTTRQDMNGGLEDYVSSYDEATSRTSAIAVRSTITLVKPRSRISIDENTPKTADIFLEPESSNASYVTAYSTISANAFYTPLPSCCPSNPLEHRFLKETDRYAQQLKAKRLWPVEPAIEQNWSGRGQHAVFQRNERQLIGGILQVRDTLAITNTSKVEIVKCRRILLARKTTVCSRVLKESDVIEEVAHLTRLSHSHIVRLIGTYVVGKELSILLYPVAEHNLDDFLRSIRSSPLSSHKAWKTGSCCTFFACLSSAVDYIHSRLTKHLDIKPQNILVREKCKDLAYTRFAYAVYLADFGIARSYNKPAAANTDGLTPFTPKYAAPEVVKQELRDLAADIFSLGCVFLEIYSTLQDADRATIGEFDDEKGIAWVSPQGRAWASLQRLLSSGQDTSYHANLTAIGEFCARLSILNQMAVVCYDTRTDPRQVIIAMMAQDPELRPDSDNICTLFMKQRCCSQGPCKLEAVVDGEDEGNDNRETLDNLGEDQEEDNVP